MSGNFFNRVKKRDDQLFTDLMASCQSELYRLAWRYLKNEHDALDALQEVSCRVYKHFYKVENPKYVKTWMIRIMINYCLDELKRQKKAMPVDSVPDRFETPPDQAANSMIPDRKVQRCSAIPFIMRRSTFQIVTTKARSH